jgi:hypothetical protein
MWKMRMRKADFFKLTGCMKFPNPFDLCVIRCLDQEFQWQFIGPLTISFAPYLISYPHKYLTWKYCNAVNSFIVRRQNSKQ